MVVDLAIEVQLLPDLKKVLFYIPGHHNYTSIQLLRVKCHCSIEPLLISWIVNSICRPLAQLIE